MAGGWVVGKSDFNENPVVSLDLDLDLDFNLGFVNLEIENLQLGLHNGIGSANCYWRSE